MKKILLILLLSSISTYSQYSKKEYKKLKKYTINISNKGLDLRENFVFVGSGEYKKSDETFMNQILFENGFEVGDYYFAEETNTNVINGRYVIKNGFKSFTIKDLNTNKIVCTIKYNKYIYFGDTNYGRLKMDYVFKKLIESNK